MGGDGIVHQVAQSLVGTETFLAVIPAGTTNVFARQLNIPAKPVKAGRLLAGEPKLVRVPVATVEATRSDLSHSLRHAVFALGVGVDADVVAAAETEPFRKLRFGAVHYLRTSLGLLWTDIRQRRPTVTVVDGNQTATVVGVMAQFHPAFTYFGARPIRFSPEPPDPMTLLLMERMNVRHLPALLYRVARGDDLTAVTGIDVWEHVKTFDVAAPAGASFEVDGELLGELVTATVTFRPDARWVAGPPDG